MHGFHIYDQLLGLTTLGSPDSKADVVGVVAGDGIQQIMSLWHEDESVLEGTLLKPDFRERSRLDFYQIPLFIDESDKLVAQLDYEESIFDPSETFDLSESNIRKCEFKPIHVGASMARVCPFLYHAAAGAGAFGLPRYFSIL